MTELTVEKIEWPCPLSDKLKQQLFDAALPIEGIPNVKNRKGIYYVSEGIFICYYSTEHLNNNLGFVIGPNQWIGASKIRENIKHFLQYITIEPIKGLFLSQTQISHIAETNNEIYKLLYHCLGNIQPLHLQAPLTAMQNKEVRVAYTLLSLAQKKQVIKGTKISFAITQEQLSLVTGISRPRVNEVLKKLENSNEISINRGRICILDIDALGNRLDDSIVMFHDPRKRS